MAKTKKKVDGPSRSKRGQHCQWTEASMAATIQAVRDQHVSQRQACKTFCVPRCTLQSRVSGKVDIGAKAEILFANFKRSERIKNERSAGQNRQRRKQESKGVGESTEETAKDEDSRRERNP